MEFIQLKYFQAVAKTGKIVTAAKSMFVTPPAISSAISQLERELGTPLFSRVGNRLTLNQQGQILLRHANVILFNFGAAKAAILESLPEGPMHISVAATQTHLLSGLITDFSVHHPNHTITLNSTNGEALFKGAFQYRYAFLLTAESQAIATVPEECDRICLFEDYPAIMVSKDHPLAQQKIVRISDLEGYSLIHPRTYPDYFSRIFSLYENLELPQPLIRTFSHLVCQTMTMQGRAVCMTSMRAAKANPEKFVHIPLEAPGISWTTYLYWRKDRTMSPAERTLLRFMSEYYQVELPKHLL